MNILSSAIAIASLSISSAFAAAVAPSNAMPAAKAMEPKAENLVVKAPQSAKMPEGAKMPENAKMMEKGATPVVSMKPEMAKK